MNAQDNIVLPARAASDAAASWRPQPARNNNSAQTAQQRSARGPVVRRTSVVTLVIPALKTLEYSAAGCAVQLLASPCPLEIQYETSAGFVTFAPGFGVQISRKTPFELLVIKNPLSSAISIVLYIGWGRHKCEIAPAFLVTPIENWVAAVTGVVTPLSATPVYFRNGFFYGYTGAPAGVAPTDNAANVYIGKTNNLPDIAQPGDWVQYQAPAGQLFNLQNFNILGTTGDGIFYSLT